MRYAKYLFVFVAMFVLMACDKEDEAKSTNWDINWYEIQDKPGELNHLIYEVYRDYGVPIFINDTIGSQIVDYDYDGNPIVYYEELRPGYTIQEYNTAIHYALSHDSVSLIAAVEAFRDYVMPKLPETVFTRSYLFVDSLVTTGYYGLDVSWPINKAAERYMTTTIVGRIAEMKTLTGEERKVWAGNLLGDLLVNHVRNIYEKQLEDFYLLSYTTAGKTKYRTPLVGFGNSKVAQNWGFIDFAYSNVTPSETEDVAMFLALFYNGSSEEIFKEEFAKWPKVLKKYDIMKEIVADIQANNK